MICDYAETYHVYDIYALNVVVAATLCAGLRSNSRTKMKINGDKINLQETLLALIADSLQMLVWFKTKDGHKGTNRPKSIYQSLTEEKEEIEGFMTGEEFLKKWSEL